MLEYDHWKQISTTVNSVHREIINPRKRAPTLKDVARQAGVSLVTASTVVNASCPGRPVAEETRERVLEAARSLRYSPNVMARGLKRVRLDSLGIAFHSMNPEQVSSDHYSNNVLRGILLVAHQAGYNVVHFHKPWHDARQSAANFRDQGIDGFLVVAPTAESDMVSGLAGLGIPIVVISSSSDQHGVPSVDVDNTKGARLAVEHLLSLGHRKIAHLMDDATNYDTRTRRDTFIAVMAEAGIAVPPEYLSEGGRSYTFESFHDQAHALLSLPDPPTAIFTTNDSIAFRVYDTAQEMGVRIPDDLSVVGFDDSNQATWVNPTLTSVSQPVYEMAAKATQLLIQLVEGNPVINETIWYEPQLTVRLSTAPPSSRPTP
jgi:LacI family transcriptional regulator